jgi:hypothetical protein
MDRRGSRLRVTSIKAGGVRSGGPVGRELLRVLTFARDKLTKLIA